MITVASYGLMLTLGTLLSLANLLASAVCSAVLSIVGNFEFTVKRDNRLHLGNALFMIFLLGLPGFFIHAVEAATVANRLPPQWSAGIFISSGCVFSLLLGLLFLKSSGLMRRLSPRLADGMDAVLWKIFGEG